MAQQLFFSRDTKVYFKIGSDIWEIPVLDGFSFTQATNSSEIVLAEMESTAGVSRRGKRKFNDSLAPAEWSMSTYVRPFAAVGSGSLKATDVVSETRAVEEVLWALLAGPASYSNTTFDWSHDSTASNPLEYFTWNSAANTMIIDFAQSNKSTLGTASIIFALGNANEKYYELTECVVNEATIDFDIDGIATINWSGFGATIVETTIPTATVAESITATDNFIRNRLTTLTVVPDQTAYNSGELETSYAITLTGGNITISNNITYITPEELGIVNIAIGHVTGNRSFSGNFVSYLDFDTVATDRSSDLWQDLSALTSKVTHDFALTFQIGGSAGDPRVEVIMPSCTIEIPTINIEDIISLEVAFDALGTTIDATDEATISYFST